MSTPNTPAVAVDEAFQSELKAENPGIGGQGLFSTAQRASFQKPLQALTGLFGRDGLNGFSGFSWAKADGLDSMTPGAQVIVKLIEAVLGGRGSLQGFMNKYSQDVNLVAGTGKALTGTVAPSLDESGPAPAPSNQAPSQQGPSDPNATAQMQVNPDLPSLNPPNNTEYS